MRRGTAAVVERLRAAGCVAAEEEADELVARAPNAAVLEAWLARRERGEPLAWITGGLSFCGRWVHVATGVYVPRVQTEELARRAAALLRAGGLAADLCTGAGAVAAHVAAAVPGARVVGTDLDVAAASCARRNGVAAIVTDLGNGLPAGRFDVVTAVVPYVPTPALRLLPSDVVAYEPRLALDGGADGLLVLHRLVGCAAHLLRPGGFLLAEVGGDQDEALAPALHAAGLGAWHAFLDEEGDLRGIVARRAGSGAGLLPGDGGYPRR